MARRVVKAFGQARVLRRKALSAGPDHNSVCACPSRNGSGRAARGVIEASRIAALGHSISPDFDWVTIASDGGAGVAVLDPQGRVLYINTLAARLFARR